MDSVESSCDTSEPLTSQETLDSELVMQIPSTSEDKQSETEEKVCLNMISETSLHVTSSNVDSDSNEEIRTLRVSPKFERSANLSLPKTTLLGKLKAKQRLNAFLALRQNITCNSPQKKLRDCDENVVKSENKMSPIKKTNKKFPDDIAKAVIEEIEMMKKVEIAMIESIEQDIYEKSQRKSRSRSRSRSRERGSRYKEQSYRRYKSHSRSLEDRRNRYLEKESYPKNWGEMKERHLKLEDVKEIKHRTSRHQKIHESHDFRKQALFSKPSLPLKPLLIKSINGLDKSVPVEYIRYTHTAPSISYNVNFLKVKEVHVSEKEVYDIAPKSHVEILEKLKDPSLSSKSFEFPKKSPRKWYLKTALANIVDVTECELLEPSLGLSILQNYTDEEDEDEKGEHEEYLIVNNAEVSQAENVIEEIRDNKKLEIIQEVDVLKPKDSRNKKDALESDQDSQVCHSETLDKQKPLLSELSVTQDLVEESRKKKCESKKLDKKIKMEHKKNDRKEKHEKKVKKRTKSKKKKERIVDYEEDKDKGLLKSKNSKDTEKKANCESKLEKSTEKLSKRKSNLKHKEQEQADDPNVFNLETYIKEVKHEINNKKTNNDDDSASSKDKNRDKGGKINDERQSKVEARKSEVTQLNAKVEKEAKAGHRKSEEFYAKEERKSTEAPEKTNDKKRAEKNRQVESFKSDDNTKGRQDEAIKTDSSKKAENLKPESNIKIKNQLKVDKEIITDTKEESAFKVMIGEVTPKSSKLEPELKTPDTEEYHSHWESDEDVSNAISYSPLPIEKPNNQIANTSWESDEEIIKNIPFHKQKTRGRYVEVSPQRSMDRRTRKLLDAPEIERSLEMPLNIKHLSRRRKLGSDVRDPLGVEGRSLYSEDSWERGEYLKLRNDIETEKLKQERESLSEERRLLEKEKRKLAEKLEQVTSNLVYRDYDELYSQDAIESSDGELRSIQERRKELLGRRHREKKEVKMEKKRGENYLKSEDLKESKGGVESKQFRLEINHKDDTGNSEVISEYNSFGKSAPGSDESKPEIPKRKRRKKRWENIDLYLENKLNIDDVLVEKSRQILDECENKPSIDEVLVENTKPKLIDHKLLNLSINLVENHNVSKIDKQIKVEPVHSNSKKDVAVLNKVSPEPTVLLTSNSVPPVNKVVILESEYEEFLKAVTSESFKDEVSREDIEVKIDNSSVGDDQKSKFVPEKKKKKRKRSITSSSSSSSSSSYSSGTDSSSSSYSSTTTSSSSTDEEKKRKKKGKKYNFSKVKCNVINELDINDLNSFPISKDTSADDKLINQIKEESMTDVVTDMNLENEENESGKAVSFCVPQPVPSPVVVPPLPLIKMSSVKEENPISSTKIDSTTSAVKKPSLIPAKFLTSAVRKQPELPLKPPTYPTQTTKFVDSFQAATVDYPVSEEMCHSSFSLPLKPSVSDMCLNENSGSQDFTELFVKKSDSHKQPETHEIANKNESKKSDLKLEELIRVNKREQSISPFVKKSLPSPRRSVSPRRLRNLSPKQTKSASPKRVRNVSPKWSPLCSSPKRIRMASPRPTRNRDLSSRSVSPKRSRKSEGRRRSPRRYLEREYSPRRRNASPAWKDMFFKNESPRRRDLSPPRHADVPLSKRSLSPRRSISPRYRNLSPRRNYSPRRNMSPHRRSKNLSPRYRSVSPRYRDVSPGGRWCYSPRSPRRRNYSPRRRRSPSPRNRRYSFSRSPSIDRSKKEPIQVTLQRLAGLEDYANVAIKSPINSPLDGFKRSLADSTISDDQLLQQNSEEFSESPGNPPLYFENKPMDLPCSPKRVPLDERINFVLGMEKETPKPINTTYSTHYAYNQYGVHYNHFPSYENQMMQKPNYVISRSNCEEKSPSTKVVQIGNVLEVVPTENIPPPTKEYIPQQKILQVGNMLQIVPAPRITTMEPLRPPSVTTCISVTPATSCIIPEAPVSPSIFMVEKISPEALMKQKISERKAQRQMRHEEREKKRREKEKRRKEKEKQRQIRIKQKTDNMIKQAILLETEALALGEDLENQESLEAASEFWPGVPVVVSNPSIKPAGKGILIFGKFSKQNVDEEASFETRKSVTFADGVLPGEGTSPSGGEELSSPPPMKIPLPKEKRYTKSIKIKKQKKVKIPKKKKIKVKIIRKAHDSQDDDSEDDNLSPPSPPPGSPPPHIFPPRIRTHTINNIHPFISDIRAFSVSTLRQFRHVNMSLPPHGPPPHGLPLLGPTNHPPHSLPQQIPPHSSIRHMTLSHETQFQNSGLSHPPPPGLHH